MDTHLSGEQEEHVLRPFRITTRAAFTGDLRYFEVIATDSYHAACQVKQIANQDLIVRIAFA